MTAFTQLDQLVASAVTVVRDLEETIGVMEWTHDISTRSFRIWWLRSCGCRQACHFADSTIAATDVQQLITALLIHIADSETVHLHLDDGSWLTRERGPVETTFRLPEDLLVPVDLRVAV